MVTDWPSCLPISEMVLIGADIRSKPLTAEDAECAEKQYSRISSNSAVQERFSLDLSPQTIQRESKSPKNSATSANSAVEFLRIFEFVKRCADVFAGIFLLFAVNFEQQGRSLRGAAQQFHGLFPVNGALTRPQVRVFIFVVVMHVGRPDVLLEYPERFRDASHHVRMSAIEADANVVEVHGVDEFDEPLGRGKLVGNVFDQHANAKWLGKGAQVLDRGHRRFEFLVVKLLVGIADVLHEKTKRNKFRDFERALHLVHGLNASGAIGGGDVDGRRTGASPLVIGVQGRMHGVEWNAGGAEPFSNFTNVLLAVGVVEVLAGGEDFDGLGSRLDEFVEQARMQSFLHINVRRYRLEIGRAHV